MSPYNMQRPWTFCFLDWARVLLVMWSLLSQSKDYYYSSCHHLQYVYTIDSVTLRGSLEEELLWLNRREGASESCAVQHRKINNKLHVLIKYLFSYMKVLWTKRWSNWKSVHITCNYEAGKQHQRMALLYTLVFPLTFTHPRADQEWLLMHLFFLLNQVLIWCFKSFFRGAHNLYYFI